MLSRIRSCDCVVVSFSVKYEGSFLVLVGREEESQLYSLSRHEFSVDLIVL